MAVASVAAGATVKTRPRVVERVASKTGARGLKVRTRAAAYRRAVGSWAWMLRGSG